MYTRVNNYVYKPINMAGKLYWRVKKDGKWTWKPAIVVDVDDYDVVVLNTNGYFGQEEE